PAPSEIVTLSLHDALPIWGGTYCIRGSDEPATGFSLYLEPLLEALHDRAGEERQVLFLPRGHDREAAARLRAIGWRTVAAITGEDRKSTRLNSSHVKISYA